MPEARERGDDLEKRIIVLIGNYGSGKTELALHFALEAAAKGKKTALVDLDVVNPYFRSAEKREMLESAGVKVIASPYATSGIDLPLVPAEVASVFDSDYECAIIDVGGDPVGATALGRYKSDFNRAAALGACVEINYVVNARRPLTGDVDSVLSMVEAIARSSRMNITNIINNTNLARETTAQDLIYGQEICDAVGEKLGIEVGAIFALPDVVKDFDCATGGKYSPVLKPIELKMRPAWLDQYE